MEIKPRRDTMQLQPRRTRRRRLVLGTAVVVYSSGLLLAGAVLHRGGVHRAIRDQVFRPLVESGLGNPGHYAKSLTVRPEQLSIDIKFRNLRRLEYQRERAMSAGVFIATPDDFVPATITHKGRPVRVRVRLKGDDLGHMEHGKWSFRVRARGSDTLLGMKQFSLHHPRERNYLNEWLFHRALGREDLIALRYRFVNVSLNGKGLGVYALEEHFDKHLIEHNRRREGPIIRFSEDSLWSDAAQIIAIYRDVSPAWIRRLVDTEWTIGSSDYTTANIDGFHTTRHLSDAAKRGTYLEGIYTLEAFRRGEVRTSQAFDADRLARFLALCDVFGVRDGLVWQNLRFYFNPVLSKLEPIGFDAMPGDVIYSLTPAWRREIPHHPLSRADGDFYVQLFEDLEFSVAYARHLQRLAQPRYLDELLAEVGEDMETALRVLWREFPTYRFSEEPFRINQAFVTAALSPAKVLQAYVRGSTANEVLVDVGNLQILPVEVLGIRVGNRTPINAAAPIVIAGRDDTERVKFQQLEFSFPAGLQIGPDAVEPVSVICRIAGTERQLTERATSHPLLPKDPTAHFASAHPNVDEFGFLQLDEASAFITIPQGTWVIDRDLIVPSGFTVRCTGGTRLDLVQGARVISFSPLHLTGTEAAPIEITSSDSTGRGIAVLQAGSESLLQYVTIDHLRDSVDGRWASTGAVLFYESPVRVDHCQFLNIKAEDAINIVRSEFSIANTTFRNTASDALDADFCAGVIEGVIFEKMGNDAIDVSGSVVRIENTKIYGAGDKAISIGERSELYGHRVTIEQSRVAVASKDQSRSDLRVLAVRGCEYGLCVFQKKPEYGPSTLRVLQLTMDQVTHPYLVEDASLLQVEHETIASNTKAVRELIYVGDE